MLLLILLTIFSSVLILFTILLLLLSLLLLILLISLVKDFSSIFCVFEIRLKLFKYFWGSSGGSNILLLIEFIFSMKELVSIPLNLNLFFVLILLISLLLLSWGIFLFFLFLLFSSLSSFFHVSNNSLSSPLFTLTNLVLVISEAIFESEIFELSFILFILCSFLFIFILFLLLLLIL